MCTSAASTFCASLALAAPSRHCTSSGGGPPPRLLSRRRHLGLLAPRRGSQAARQPRPGRDTSACWQSTSAPSPTPHRNTRGASLGPSVLLAALLLRSRRPSDLYSISGCEQLGLSLAAPLPPRAVHRPQRPWQRLERRLGRPGPQPRLGCSRGHVLGLRGERGRVPAHARGHGWRRCRVPSLRSHPCPRSRQFGAPRWLVADRAL